MNKTTTFLIISYFIIHGIWAGNNQAVIAKKEREAGAASVLLWMPMASLSDLNVAPTIKGKDSI